jgi:hypothetical protein
MYIVVCADRRFQNTGIERAAALEKDIQWFQDTYSLEPPAVTEDGPGEEYSRRGSALSSSLGQLTIPLLAHIRSYKCPLEPLISGAHILLSAEADQQGLENFTICKGSCVQPPFSAARMSCRERLENEVLCVCLL